MRAQWIPLALVVAAGCSDTLSSGVLDAPADLTSVSLDRAVLLTWSDNAYQNNPNDFGNYRVYTTSYSLDTEVCGTNWTLEGTTVAPEFVIGALQNGVPRCFYVTARSKGDTESDRSPVRFDTPRPDARNVVLFARQQQNAGSGFRFWDDLNDDGITQSNELGLVRAGSSSTIDFSVERDGTGALFLHPVRDWTGVELYSESQVEDLTSIDFAAFQDYRDLDIEAVPGYGYVFEMDAGDEFARYGAIRITHVSPAMLVFDWAFQTDPGNPELKVGRGTSAAR